MVVNYIPLDQVIERVYINAGYSDIPWTDAIEHIGSAIRLIGLPNSFITKVTDGSNKNNCPITITDYQGVLPCDIVYLIQAREFTKKVPLIYSTDNFHLNQNLLQPDEVVTYPTDYTLFNQLTEVDIANDPVLRSYFMNYKSTHEWETIVYEMDKSVISNMSLTDALTYYIQGNVIFTNFKTGFVELAYKAQPVDANGVPLVPDDEKFIRALQNYLIERIDYKLWRQGQLLDKIYQHSCRERDWAIAAAKVGGRIPTIDQMEGLKNMWLRLIPQVNEHANGFKTMNVQEVRYRK